MNLKVKKKSLPYVFHNPSRNERLIFYLGKTLFNSNKVDLKKFNAVKTVQDLKQHQFRYQANCLIELLIRTNNQTKEFMFNIGDVVSKENYLTLVKNRCPNNNDSVILRNIGLKRHWGNFYNPPSDDSFSNKKNMLIWRGTTTGLPNQSGNRFSLVEKWFKKNQLIDVGFSNIVQGRHNYKKYVVGSEDIKTILKYKYILSVEGNDKDSGLNWKLNSNSVVFMTKPRFCSWLMETKLLPNYHYVLIKDDFSDLLEKIQLCNKNPNICKQIIKNAHNYMSQFKNKEFEEDLENSVINTYFKKTGQQK